MVGKSPDSSLLLSELFNALFLVVIVVVVVIIIIVIQNMFISG